MSERRRSSRLDRTPGRALVNLSFVAARLRRRRDTLALGIDLRWLVALVVVLGGAAALALGFDGAAAEWALALPDGLHSAASAISEVGRSQWILIASGVPVLVLLMGRWLEVAPRLRAAWAEIGFQSAYVFVAIGGGVLIVNVLKQIIGRGRPIGYEVNGALSFDPFNFDYGNASFPSGHSTTAGAFLIAFSLVFPRFRPLFIVIAGAIAVSRVVVGAHFPSDVLAGLCLGAAWALIAARLFAWRGMAFLRRDGRLIPRRAAVRTAWRRLGPGAVLLAPLRALAGPRAPLD